MLRVADLDVMTRHYSDVMALKVIADYVSIVLPDSESFGETIERLNHFCLEAKAEKDLKVNFDDPWSNQVTLVRNA